MIRLPFLRHRSLLPYHSSRLRHRYLHLLLSSISKINLSCKHSSSTKRARAFRIAADRCFLKAAAISTPPLSSSSSMASASLARHLFRHQHIHRPPNIIHRSTKTIKRHQPRISYLKALRSSNYLTSSQFCCKNRRLSARNSGDHESDKLIMNRSIVDISVSGPGSSHMHPEQMLQQSEHGGVAAVNNNTAVADHNRAESSRHVAIAIPSQEDLSRLHAAIFSDHHHQSLLIDHHPANFARTLLLQASSSFVGQRYGGNRSSVPDPATFIAPINNHSLADTTNLGNNEGNCNYISSPSSGQSTIINPATLLSQAAHYILALQLQVDTLQTLLN